MLDHLLLYCEVACALWNATCGLLGMYWVLYKRVVDLLACWICNCQNVFRQDTGIETACVNGFVFFSSFNVLMCYADSDR